MHLKFSHKTVSVLLIFAFILPVSVSRQSFASEEAQENASQEPPKDSLFYRLKNELHYMVKKPFTMDGADWRNLGVASLAVGGAAIFDKDIRNSFHNRENEVIKNLEIFGNGLFVGGLFVGFYGLSKITKEETDKQTFLLGIESLAWSGAITSLLKYSTGRQRPSVGDHWFSGGDSFPSGHTATAFAAARVLDYQYFSIAQDDPATEKFLKYSAKAGIYSLASLVGYQRIYSNKHYLSDVIAGAIIGSAIANMVINLNKNDKQEWGIKPAERLSGLAMYKEF